MPDKRKRIFMVGYSTDKGGVESYIRNICELLKEDFDIIFHWPVMKIDGKEWIMPENRHNIFLYNRFWRKFFRENKFDVIYFNTCDIVSIDLLKFAKKAGIPVRIIHSHCTDLQVQRKGLIGLLHRFQEKSSRNNLHKYATNLLACSKNAGDWMFDGRQYQVIENGIAISKYKYSPERGLSSSTMLKSRSHPVIACLGRLDSQKNPFFSLSIFKEVCRLDNNAQCLFIGDGEHRDELKDLVNKAGLQDRIIFTGAVDNVNDWLSYIDCIVMPSFFEGLPFALVEAQAAGLQCLVSDKVSEESNLTGLIKFKSLKNSPSEWASCALKMAELPRQDVSNKLIEAGFDIEQTASNIKNLILRSLKV